MKIRWLLEGNKEEIGKALKEWKENFDNTMLELSKKSVETPFGKFPVPIFTINYEEVDKGYIYEVNLPFEKIPKILLWGGINKAKKSLEKFFKSKNIKVKIKELK